MDAMSVLALVPWLLPTEELDDILKVVMKAFLSIYILELIVQ